MPSLLLRPLQYYYAFFRRSLSLTKHEVILKGYWSRHNYKKGMGYDVRERRVNTDNCFLVLTVLTPVSTQKGEVSERDPRPLHI